jgi:hypothetical protein
MDHQTGEERYVGVSSPWKGISGVGGPKCGEAQRRFGHRHEREAEGRRMVLTVCIKERKERGGGKGCGGDRQHPFKWCGRGVEEGGRAVGGGHAAGRSWGWAWGDRRSGQAARGRRPHPEPEPAPVEFLPTHARAPPYDSVHPRETTTSPPDVCLNSYTRRGELRTQVRIRLKSTKKLIRPKGTTPFLSGSRAANADTMLEEPPPLHPH